MAFQSFDWVVLSGYFLLLAITGVLLSRKKQRNADDYFLGGRSMPMWAVAFSVLATSQSAATFLGGPQSAYSGNLTYLSNFIGQLLASLIVAFLFIPVFYRHRVTTVYEMLEQRVGTPAKLAASWTFMVGRIFASGARLFMGALAMTMILFEHTITNDIAGWQIGTAIGVMTVIGITYTLIGGIRSVIWTDVIQTVVYVGAAVAGLVVLWRLIPADAGAVHQALLKGMPDGSSKLAWLQITPPQGTGFFSSPYTIWTAMTGFLLLHLGFLGTDQDGVQRMLTCKNAWEGSKSMLGAIVLGVPVTLLFMLVGLLLWVAYKNVDLMQGQTLAEPKENLKIFLHFIMTQMPAGMRGLMMAGLIAAGLSSLNSALNAMSATFVNDAYRPRRPNREPAHYVRVGRLGVVLFGILLGCFATFCFYWVRHSAVPLLDFALAVMAFAYSGLVAVFLSVMFLRRGSNASVIVALAVGFSIVLVMQKAIWVKVAPQAWQDVNIAFPWQMTLATSAALIVCCLGGRCKKAPAMDDADAKDER